MPEQSEIVSSLFPRVNILMENKGNEGDSGIMSLPSGINAQDLLVRVSQQQPLPRVSAIMERVRGGGLLGGQ